VKDRRVDVGDHIDAGPKQRRVDAAVGFVVPAGRPRVGQRFRLDEVIALEDDTHPNLRLLGGKQRGGDRQRIEFL
jgi:hypothetical protein